MNNFTTLAFIMLVAFSYFNFRTPALELIFHTFASPVSVVLHSKGAVLT